MIVLVDTSVWTEHFHRPLAAIAQLTNDLELASIPSRLASWPVALCVTAGGR